MALKTQTPSQLFKEMQTRFITRKNSVKLPEIFGIFQVSDGRPRAKGSQVHMLVLIISINYVKVASLALVCAAFCYQHKEIGIINSIEYSSKSY